MAGRGRLTVSLTRINQRAVIANECAEPLII
jgi:hypothetical protein